MRTAACLSGIFVCLVWLCLVLDGLGTGRSLMLYLMHRYAPSEQTGLPEEEYSDVCGMITGYLAGQSDTFQYTYEKGGREYTVFQEHEILHMKDVKGLFLLERRVLLFASVGLVITGLVLIRCRLGRPALQGIRDGGALVLCLLLVLTLMALFDFETFFTGFHRLFFTNNLWILNPRTDMLIRLMPETFFTAYAGILAGTFLPVPLACLIAPWCILKKKGN